MPSTSGDFGGPKAPPQCTAKSRRTGQRCKGPAVAGSRTQKCRMHGGGSQANGQRIQNGRASMFLPSKLGELYEEALGNPDLLEMSSHIALLEARMNEILGDSTVDHVVPRWKDMASAVADLSMSIQPAPGLVESDVDRAKRLEGVSKSAARLSNMVNSGIAWDSTWEQVTHIMDNIRKLTDTEVRRKKELNQLVPVERVIVLMVAVGDAIKRCVTNQDEVIRVQREINRLVMSDQTMSDRPRLDPAYAVLPPEDIGPSGGRSREATRRAHRQRREEEARANQEGASQSDSE